MTTTTSIDTGVRPAFVSANAIPPNVPINGGSVEIAPWLEEPDTPTQFLLPQRSFGFPQKKSISSFRQGSTSNLTLARTRASEANSIAETVNFTQSDKSIMVESHKPKSKPSIMNILKKKKSRIGKDDAHHASTISLALYPPPSPTTYPPFESFLNIPPSPPPPAVPKKHHRKKYGPRSPAPPPVPPKVPEITLDTNLDEMDGIVDMTVLAQDTRSIGSSETSSQLNGFSGAYYTHGLSSDGGLTPVSSSLSRPYNGNSSTMVFNNPFSVSPTPRRHIGVPSLDLRKVSPKTILPTPSPPRARSHSPPAEEPHSPGWIAPESWAVEKLNDTLDVPDYSSSDEEDRGRRHPRQSQQISRRPVARDGRRTNPPIYEVRIHRLNGLWHVVKCPLTTTVAELIPVLNKKLLFGAARTREPHSLYVKERERERILAPTERPADLVRRRLEQAGYDVADGLQALGSDGIGFLIKFIYKSNLLGGGEQDLAVDSYEYIDLTGRSLKTIPVLLHSHADTIITLNLSRNPMLEIPLDFIQSCITLRELRLSNMAIKKVPQSVRHSASLNRLDISCNRIADLDEAGLDRIQNLASLKAQNNRMDKLPWYFPRLRALKFLNISNNKFQELPFVIPSMTSLVDLDISFNEIASLPEEIGQLTCLERLVMVGNQISRLPEECMGLIRLATLDCRRNNISDLSLVSQLPRLVTLLADHNAIHALDLIVGPRVQILDVSYNDITQLLVGFGPLGPTLSPVPPRLTSLNLSHAKLSNLDESALSQLTSLTELRLDHNSFRFIPDSLGDLTELVYLSCSDNQLDALPESIGHLQKLVCLDVHNNSLSEMPASMWLCGSLHTVNLTSNLLRNWHDPPAMALEDLASTESALDNLVVTERKLSSAGSIISVSNRGMPPLVQSLQRLYLGENKLTEDVLHPLTMLKELRVFNLSFNRIQELPSSFFRNLTSLVELYLSGNKLSAIPTEDLHRLTKLTVLFLNGNKLQTLPRELGEISSLTVLDVGSNVLKYNINNYEFDWNWNFNKNLRYLNLSGNKRLRIQPDKGQRVSMLHHIPQAHKHLADFSGVGQLKVLGLMDVTISASSSIPEDSEERRVRTSLSEVNQMPYGIADTLGKSDHLSMLDLVIPEFRERHNECIFAMFGRSHNNATCNRIPKFLCEHFAKAFTAQLETLNPHEGEDVPDALRRTFLSLNKALHTYLAQIAAQGRKMSQSSTASATTSMQYDMSLFRSGAAGVVVYFVGRTMYVANAGDALAVISRHGFAHLVSKKHEPFDREETTRIRLAEGWVSPKGLVNEEIEVSRSFGYYHLLPAVNPRPYIHTWDISESDEFLIIANRGLWDYVTYQTAVDIARSERADPMIAAQKLRDFAISYGADGSTMIMIISVSAMFEARSRQPTAGSLYESDGYVARRPAKARDQDISDITLTRLPDEVSAPTGHIALVFTDIRNSTHLWEINPGMSTAMRLHNSLLRRQLRLCGGYEVKTEGDAFMCSFTNILSALQWCLTVQLQLLNEAWPLEILECEDGKEIRDSEGKLIARGLSVRMGIHCGKPLCEPDPITHRMDYIGPMVNRASRVTSSAAGGQVMLSSDAVREIKARLFNADPDFENDPSQIAAIDTVRGLGVEIVHVGEVKLKGFEVPESLSLVYPHDLIGRVDLKESVEEDPDPSASKVQFSVDQMRNLALLCVRLEFLASNRVFRPLPPRKNSIHSAQEERREDSIIVHAEPDTLIPTISDKASDRELMALLDLLALRIENALATLTLQSTRKLQDDLAEVLEQGGQLDQQTLMQLLSCLRGITPSQLS